MMKGTRIIYIGLVLVLALSFGVAQAQEPSANLVMVLYQSAPSGTMADNGDGTYALTLEGVSDTLWFDSAPVGLDRASTELVVSGWAQVAPESVEAVLVIEGLKVALALSAPEFDIESQNVTYQAAVTGVVSADPDVDPDKVELPETFGAADLAISMDLEIAAQILEAIQSGVRATSCDPLFTAYANAYSAYRACTSDCSDENAAMQNAFFAWRACVYGF